MVLTSPPDPFTNDRMEIVSNNTRTINPILKVNDFLNRKRKIIIVRGVIIPIIIPIKTNRFMVKYIN